MIGKLKGVIDAYGEDFVIVDVHGVGYEVHCSARTLQALPSVGEAVMLAIETHVREDQIRLFGFLSDLDREWFRRQNIEAGTHIAYAATGAATLVGSIGTGLTIGDISCPPPTPTPTPTNTFSPTSTPTLVPPTPTFTATA